MIVKVQVPVFPPDGLALIYNKSRSKIVQRPVDDDLRKKMKGKLKAYFRAKVHEGDIRLLRQVSDQSW